mgnify:CR=1 FL=1
MKKFVTLLLAAIMVLTMAVGLASENTIVYGVTSSMSGDMGFNQWSSLGGDKPVIYLAEAMSPTCFDQDALWEWDPTVVAAHDQVSNEDGTLTYTITLNDGLKFSNGEAITAKNYVAYPLLFASPAAVSVNAYGTAGKEYVGQQAYKNGEAKTFAGIRLIDDLTFSITVSQAYNPYYYGLALLNIYPIDYTMWLGDDSWDVVDDGEGCYFAGNGEMSGEAITAARYLYDGRVCSGPYYIESWDVAANEATLKINPNYPGNFEGQKPSIETVVVKLVDSATMLDQLQTGSVDLIDGIGEGYMINACLDLAEQEGYAANVYKYSGYMKLFYQCDWGPTQYDAVRQAITYLCDRETLCQETTLGFGNVTNGQYSMAQWMALDMEEELSSELEAYAYNPDKAVELLKADGWVYNADGSDYVDGSGEIRYKKVPEAEAQKGSSLMPGVVELNGEFYMPLVLEYCGHQAGEGIETMLDESLTINLLESASTKAAGMKFNKTVMSDAELCSYLNRRGANGEEKYTQPSYNVLSLASGLGAAKFDKSGTWTFDEANIANNKNRYFNHTLDDLSNNMIYGVEAGDDETFEKLWFEYQKEYNAHLPETPLYNWTYCAVFNSKLQGFEETNIWSFQYAILYATIQ